jgi:hypothetical protein
LSAPFEAAYKLLPGKHLITGATQQVYRDLSSTGLLKCITSTETLCLNAKAVKPSLVIIFRSLHTTQGMTDGPDVAGWITAGKYYSELRPYLVPGFDYYEYINEWNPPTHQREADWNIEMLSLLTKDGKCGLAFSPGPGNPEFSAWDSWVKVLRWIDTHPCSTNPLRYHGIALHQSGELPADIITLPNSYIRNTYITRRHEMVRSYLLAHTGYDLALFRGPIYLTEMGWQNYTIPDQPFSCEQVRRGVLVTEALYRSTQLVDGYALWNFGSAGGKWVDLTPCIEG